MPRAGCVSRPPGFLKNHLLFLSFLFLFFIFSLSPRLFSRFQGGCANRRVVCLMVKGWWWVFVGWHWLTSSGHGLKPGALCGHGTPRRVLLRRLKDLHVWLEFTSLHSTSASPSILCISLFPLHLFTVPLFYLVSSYSISFLFSSIPSCFHLTLFFSILLLLFLPHIHPLFTCIISIRLLICFDKK